MSIADITGPTVPRRWVERVSRSIKGSDTPQSGRAAGGGRGGELPLERRGDLLVAAAEREQMLLERVEVGEVVGRETLRWTTEK